MGANIRVRSFGTCVARRSFQTSEQAYNAIAANTADSMPAIATHTARTRAAGDLRASRSVERIRPHPMSIRVAAIAGTEMCARTPLAAIARPNRISAERTPAARELAPAATCAAERLNDPEPAKPLVVEANTLAAPWAKRSRAGSGGELLSGAIDCAMIAVCNPPTIAMAIAL